MAKHNRACPSVANKQQLVKSSGSYDDTSFYFSLEYHWYKTMNIKGFNNQLPSSEALGKEIDYIMGELFPIVQKEYKNIFSSSKQFTHCHKVSNDKYPLISNILNNIDSRIVFNDIKSYLWQIGIKQDIRVFGVYLNYTFTPLFIDRHHMIYPDIHHNQKDIKSYSYCIG